MAESCKNVFLNFIYEKSRPEMIRRIFGLLFISMTQNPFVSFCFIRNPLKKQEVKQAETHDIAMNPAFRVS